MPPHLLKRPTDTGRTSAKWLGADRACACEHLSRFQLARLDNRHQGPPGDSV